MASKKKKPAPESKDSKGDKAAPGRSLLTLVLVPLMSIGALFGGLVAAIGVDGLMGLVSSSEKQAVSENGATGEAEAAKAEKPGKTSSHDVAKAEYGIINFEDMIMNIGGFTKSGEKTTRFMKISLSLIYDQEPDSEDQEDLVAAQELFMRDVFQDYLRQLTERDLEGSIGLVRVREELVRRARAIVGNEAPREILIGDLIIQ